MSKDRKKTAIRAQKNIHFEEVDTKKIFFLMIKYISLDDFCVLVVIKRLSILTCYNSVNTFIQQRHGGGTGRRQNKRKGKEDYLSFQEFCRISFMF